MAVYWGCACFILGVVDFFCALPAGRCREFARQRNPFLLAHKKESKVRFEYPRRNSLRAARSVQTAAVSQWWGGMLGTSLRSCFALRCACIFVLVPAACWGLFAFGCGLPDTGEGWVLVGLMVEISHYYLALCKRLNLLESVHAGTPVF